MRRTEAARPAPSAAAIRPETELLFLLARTRMTPEMGSQVRALLSEELDWIRLVGDALSHDLLPLVYVHLKAAGRGVVPEPILEQLARYFEEHVRRNARRVEELLRLLRLLEARSIPALPFKGPTLAVAAYGDLSLRTFCDLDFLIRRRDVVAAMEVLRGAGYRLERTPLGPDGFPSERGKYQYFFRHEGDDSIAELHFRLTPQHLHAALDFEYLEGRRQWITLHGAAIPSLPPEDLLLVLCVHGDHHYWGLLKWICDVAELVRANPHMNWGYVEVHARRLGCWRMVALGLRLASDLLGAPLPRDVWHRIRQDIRISRVAARVRSQLLSEEEPGTAESDAIHPYHPLELLERLSDRVWIGVLFVQLVLTVNSNDTRLVRLPGLLRVAYYPLRMIRILAKYGLIPLVRRVRSRIRPEARSNKDAENLPGPPGQMTRPAPRT